MAGFRVQRDVFLAYVLCGALAGLGGFMFLARFGNITVVAGQGLELQVVAAVVVGGVNIFGGVGSVVGALLGATLIDLLQQSLIRWLGVSQFLQRRAPGAADPARRRLGQDDPRQAPGHVRSACGASVTPSPPAAAESVP